MVAAAPLAEAAGAAAARCATSDEAFLVFACLWGQMQLLRLCASLCRNQLTLLEWLTSAGPRAGTMLLSSVMCVAVPNEATILAAICSSLASAWALMPDDVDTGGVYELLVHVNLLAGLLWSLLTGRPACEGWSASGPAVRCLLVLVFSFAALARLNADYHDVRRSSSTVLAIQFLDSLGASLGIQPRAVKMLGERVVTIFLWALLLVLEALGLAVPVLLLCGRVTAGLAIAWVLALALATTTVFDASCLLVASLPFWVPPNRVLLLRWMTVSPTARGVGVAAAVVLMSPTLLQRSSHAVWRLHLLSVMWLLAANPLQYTAVGSLPLQTPGCERASGITPSGFIQHVARLTVLLALLNGACPYLGLKTQSTWSALSNLRVEGGVSNHLLIPAWLQPFSYTRECVTVTKTNVPALQELHIASGGAASLRLLKGFVERTGTLSSVHSSAPLCSEPGETPRWDAVLPYEVPFFQLRRVVAIQTMPLLQDFFVEYLHCGAPHSFKVQNGAPLAGLDPRLAREPPALLWKFLAFRSAPAGERGGLCTH